RALLKWQQQNMILLHCSFGIAPYAISPSNNLLLHALHHNSRRNRDSRPPPPGPRDNLPQLLNNIDLLMLVTLYFHLNKAVDLRKINGLTEFIFSNLTSL